MSPQARGAWRAVLSIALCTALPPGPASPEPPMRPTPSTARDALRKLTEEAVALLPAPEAPYVPRLEESKLEVDGSAPWDRAIKSWARPARATAERYYDVPDDTPGLSRTRRDLLGPIEVTVELNGELRVGDLASEGGPATLFPVRDATAVEVTTIEPGAAQGRAMPMPPGQAEYRLAVITVFWSDRKVESAVRQAVAKRTTPHAAGRPAGSPAEVHRICFRLHGPKKVVESLAARLPSASIRRLLRG